MSRRTLAIVVAVPLTGLLLIAALALPIPYVLYEPGTTVDLLSTERGEERIQVDGHQAYYDGGELRMTTIYVTQPGDSITLGSALFGWLDRDDSVQAYDAVYAPDETEEENDAESALQMSTSQDVATAVALTDLGYDVPVVPVVGRVTKDAPADGKLEVADRFVTIGGTPIKTLDDVSKAVSASKVGEPLAFVVERKGARETIQVEPRRIEGRPRVGIEVGVDYEFPFDVHVNIAENIGGPSAGLMFSLSIYDTLTPGSLTDGRIVAGTGTIDPDGQVGPIGGIQQKIASARDAGAELFLVPESNCDEAVDAPADDVRLVKVATMSEARKAIETYADDPDADLPTCEDD